MNKEIIGQNSISYLKKGKGQPLLFLHGMGIHVKHYTSLIDNLSSEFEVIAPLIYGFNIFSNQPSSVEDYSDITEEFLNRLKIKPVSAGHSMGGTVAINSGDSLLEIAVLNPTLPTQYGLPSFMARGIYKGSRELLGVSAETNSRNFGLKLPIPFITNLLKNIPASKRLIEDLSTFDYRNVNLERKVTMIYGEEDEYFNLNEQNEQIISRVSENFEIKRLPKLNHDWPVYNPRIAANEIYSALNK